MKTHYAVILSFAAAVFSAPAGLDAAKPPSGSPHTLTITGGDGSAAAQTLTGTVDASQIDITGTHTATIDFLGMNATGACSGNVGLLAVLQGGNPISSTSMWTLIDKVQLTGGVNHVNWPNVFVGSTRYSVNFGNPTTLNVTSSGTEDTVVFSAGDFSIHQRGGAPNSVTCVGMGDLTFTVSH